MNRHTIRHRGRFVSYNAPKTLINVDLMRLMPLIQEAINQTLDQQSGVMFRMAQSKAPVRKMYRGGRATIRKLTASEIQRQSPIVARAMTTAMRENLARSHPTLKTITGSTASQSVPQGGTRVVTHRNSMTKWNEGHRRDLSSNIPKLTERAWIYQKNRNHHPLVARKIEVDTTYKRYSLMTSRAKYDLEHANIVQVKNSERLDFRDVGRGAIYWDMNEKKFFFGGNLRGSVNLQHRDGDPNVQRVVSAGGERAPYARYVEFGTRKMAARPFLRPAINHVRVTFRDRLFTTLKKIEKANPMPGL